MRLLPDKGHDSGDEYRNQYEDKDYELLPGASLNLTGGFEFDAAAAGKSFTVDVVDESEVLGATVYEMTDHLGNVRIAMTQEETSVDFKTNLENPDGGGFMNMETRHQDIAKNHTPGGSWSSWLNPAAADGYTVGPAITLMVSPGDVVNMKVFGMYTNDTGGDETVTEDLATAVAGGLTQTGGLEPDQVVSLFSGLLTGAAAVIQPNSNVPKAYLKYILFDRNMVMKKNGHDVLEGSANNWEELSLLNIPIEHAGYIYIYVANESEANVDVHFDDMEVQLIEAPAVNGTDYYPYGLAMDGRSWASEPYRFGYQGQFSEYDDETGWNSFELRMYDSKIGRFNVTDPYGQFASPYLGMANNPISGIDPNGGYLFGLFGSTSEQRQKARTLAAIKGGDVLNITSGKNIAVTWQEKIPTLESSGDLLNIVRYTQDFSLDEHLTYSEAVQYNAYQGDYNALNILRNSGFERLAFNLHFQGMHDRAGVAFMQFGFSVVTAPLSFAMISTGSSLIGMGTSSVLKSSVNIAGRQAMRTGLASATTLESSVAATNFLYRTIGVNPSIRTLTGGLIGRLPTMYGPASNLGTFLGRNAAVGGGVMIIGGAGLQTVPSLLPKH